MSENYFISELENPEFQIRVQPSSSFPDARAIGVDHVHFSGDFPAVYFKEVIAFDHETLTEIAEIKKNIWNQSLVGFLHVASASELRIYDCNKLPFDPQRTKSLDAALKAHEIERCIKSDLEKLAKLKRVFSLAAIDSGALWNIPNPYRNKIDVSKRIDKRLIKSLSDVFKKIKAIEGNTIEDNVLHRLLMRCLFIMYLQDRGAIPAEIFHQVGSDDFLKSLSDHSVTYQFFDLIIPHFNGNIFPVLGGEDIGENVNQGVVIETHPAQRGEKAQVTPQHLKLIQCALYDGDLNLEQTKLLDWRLFDFRFIRIELLSEVYEGFLKETDPKRQKQKGVYYTPVPLVNLILRQVLPDNSADYQVRVCDPACGSGNFLVQAYQRIVKRWKNAHPERRLTFKVLCELMKASIFGVEIDPNSIRVAAFSLYLTMLNYLEPADVWLEEGDKFPNLIRDVESGIGGEENGNLFREDTISENPEFLHLNYDFIVGNPPFGTTALEINIKEYCDKFGFSNQYAIPFMHRLAERYPFAKIAFVFNGKLLFNTKKSARNFQNWLLGECYVERIFNLSIFRKAPKKYGGNLFSGATVPICVAFYQRKCADKESASIEYWAPKTYVRNLLSENILIDGADIKFVPRYLGKNPSSSIWKIAQWGTLQDFYLIERLRNSSNRTFGGTKNLKKAVGFELLTSKKDRPLENEAIKSYSYLDADQMRRYYVPNSVLQPINNSIKTDKAIAYYSELFGEKDRKNWPSITKFRRLGNLEAFAREYKVLVKEGMSDNRFCAAIVDYSSSFTKTILGITSESCMLLNAVTGYLNSQFCSYFLYLTSSSWGIERDRIKPNELNELPGFPVDFDPSILGVKVLWINEFLSVPEKHNRSDQEASILEIGLPAKDVLDITKIHSLIDVAESEIEHIVAELFDLLPTEKILIEDFVKYSIDLFLRSENSIALEPIDPYGDLLVEYAKMLQDTLNHEFEDETIMITTKPYAPNPDRSLCLVIASFVNAGHKPNVEIRQSNPEFDSCLMKLNDDSIQKHSPNIFVQKHILLVSGDDVFILKPNQKRHWTRSSAIEDAYTIVGEIMNQQGR